VRGRIALAASLRPRRPPHPPDFRKGCAMRKATLARYGALLALVGSLISGLGRIDGWPWP